MNENEADGRLLWFSNQYTSAGGPFTRSTPKAVIPGHDPPLDYLTQVPFVDMIRSAMVHHHLKRQVEIAIVESPIPADADLAPAHESGHGCRVEGIRQKG